MGQVFDWEQVDDSNPNLTNRTSTAQLGVSLFQLGRGVNFADFEVVVVVVGVPDSYPRWPQPGATDGGSTSVQSLFRRHRAVVMRVGDNFDFVAHELGHAIGLAHSFGSPLFKTDGEQAGGYGHPYCIMSAMSYGGIGGPHVTNAPMNGWPEYSRQGPSLAAGAALGRGWIDAHHHTLAGSPPKEFELRSRHSGGRNPTLPKQALELAADGGKTYIVEFRSNLDWDEGQQTPALIVAQDGASSAALVYPDAHSTTYLSLLRLPITLGGIGSAYLGPGFAIELLDWSPGTDSVRFRVTSGHLKRTFVQATAEVETLRADVLERGETTWATGEKLCVEGTHAFEKLSKTQVATFHLTYGLAVPPVTSVWTVEGVKLTQPNQTISVRKSVRVADAKLREKSSGRTVTIRCEVQALPTGSVLRLRNVPSDETYDVAVSGTIQTAVGSATETFLEEFNGIKYDYGQEFTRARLHCLTDLSDVGSRYATYEVLVEPERWRKIPKGRREELERMVTVLAHLKSGEDQLAYEATLSEVSTQFGIRPQELRVRPRRMATGFPLPEGHPAPPSPVTSR